MASNIVKYALLGGGAYLLWQSGALSSMLQSLGIGAPAAAAPPPTTTGGTPTTTGGGGATNTPPTGTQYVPPNTRAQLLAAIAKDNNVFYTQQGNKFNADQWKYYYDALAGNAGKLDAAGYEALFFPSGRPADASQYPVFDVDAFLASIATKGLSGLAAIMPTPVASLVQRAASGDLVAAVRLTQMGIKIPVGNRRVSPAALLAQSRRAGVHGIHLGGLPVGAFRV